jgi:colanic acid/amylovoran biosynthesis protein
MIVEIRGVGFINKGAELMLSAILDRVGAACPDTTFTVAPNVNGRPYENLVTLGIYPKIWFSRYGVQWGYVANWLPRQLLQLYGLKTDKEVDVVLDASGFAYSDQWGDTESIKMAKWVRRWKSQGTRVILLPQAFGPFSSRRIRRAFRDIVGHADAVYARDSVSYAHVLELVGPVPQLKQAPDFTVLLDGKVPSYFDKQVQNVAIIPNQRMVDKTTSGVSERYVGFLVTCVQEFLRAHYKPFFLIHGDPADRGLASEAMQLLRHDVPLVCESDPRVIKGIIGQCDAVVSSRYHGLVSALSQTVPALGSGWSHKYQLLFDEYGCPEMLLSLDEGEECVRERVKCFATVTATTRLRLVAPAAVHKQTATNMWSDVFRIMQTGE